MVQTTFKPHYADNKNQIRRNLSIPKNSQPQQSSRRMNHTIFCFKTTSNYGNGKHALVLCI